jgi:subtilase family serine protease
MSLSLFAGRRLPVVLLTFAAMLFALTALGADPQTSLIAGNHSPTVEKIVAPGAAPSGQMLKMRIDLNPSHRDALERLLAAQQDPSSPSYHRWLKTGEFDRRFAPDPAARAAIAQWLKQQGFEVSQSPNGRALKFTGTVEQAQRAFSVAIDSVDGGKHYGNISDPAVPSQFAPSIAFIDGLDNLRGSHTSMHAVPGSPADTTASSPLMPVAGNLLAESDGTGQPDVKLKGKTGFGPSDFYTFYDVNSLLQGKVTGTGGGCIGLIEISDYPDAGIQNFDSAFKLAAATVTRVVAPDSDNPGQNDRAGETMLDLEYSHTFAPGAAVNVYLSDPATFGGNVIEATVDALDTAVSDNSCSSLSISIESCGFPNSYYTGALHTTYINAAMQGQTVFVAEGDQGAAEYQFDPTTDTCAVGTTSRNVNELASDPNITSIGGTQFTPDYKNGNDVGFVAESVWNEGVLASGIGSGGGGASVVFSKPDFQLSGTPADGARDVPDISMEAACHTPGAFSVFPGQSSGNNVSCCACGTSLGAPVWAGIAELMVQSNGNQRIGSINTQLYKLGLEQDTAATGIRDVTNGNNDFNGVTGFDAVPGFDLASGWGTPDVATFVPAFLGATATATATATPQPTPTPLPGKLKVAPAALNFGNVELNTTSKPRTIKISNIAHATKKVTAMSIMIEGASASPSPVFMVTTNGCSAPIPPKGSCPIAVTFSPSSTTPVTGMLTITDDVVGDSMATVALKGAGKAAKK